MEKKLNKQLIEKRLIEIELKMKEIKQVGKMNYRKKMIERRKLLNIK